VKVDPEHVVCVPIDYSAQKMRVCQYEVMGNYGSGLSSTVYEADKNDSGSEDAPTEDTPAPEAEDKKSRDDSKSTWKPKKGMSSKLDKMDFGMLMELSLDELRQYAGKNLSIVGASKIPGGKTALVGRILEVRR
jgi:hypothetical protein